jgi:hypothetical protein
MLEVQKFKQIGYSIINMLLLNDSVILVFWMYLVQVSAEVFIVFLCYPRFLFSSDSLYMIVMTTTILFYTLQSVYSKPLL